MSKASEKKVLQGFVEDFVVEKCYSASLKITRMFHG